MQRLAAHTLRLTMAAMWSRATGIDLCESRYGRRDGNDHYDGRSDFTDCLSSLLLLLLLLLLLRCCC